MRDDGSTEVVRLLDWCYSGETLRVILFYGRQELHSSAPIISHPQYRIMIVLLFVPGNRTYEEIQ